MFMKIIQTLLMVFFLGASAMAQQKTYSGTVKDEAGKPMTGATVSVKGTKTSKLTDESGQFTIQAAAGNILEISFSGYETGTVKLGAEANVSVSLKPGSGDINEVVVTGTRGLPRSKLESTAPVDVLDLKSLVVEAPQTNITDILNNIAPSFNSTTQTVADGTDHIDPATVRGLGPDQTLVLVNGKRRYTSALVNVNGTMGRGSVGTDLNAIPAGSIDRIELLRDGAAAQYGSDAIAGVLNVQLNRDINKGRAIVSYGANNTT